MKNLVQLHARASVGCLILAVFALHSPVVALPIQQAATTSSIKLDQGNPKSSASVGPSRQVEVPATVRAGQEIDIYAKLGGFIKTLNVDIGDHFSSGSVLAELDIPEMETDVAQKAALIQQASAEMKQAAAAVKESEAQLAGYEAAIEEANSLRAAKEARLQFESQDFNRLSQLAQTASIRRDLVDGAQLKVLTARSDMDTIASKVATAKANLIGARAAVERAQADQLAAESRIRVAEANHKHSEQLLSYATIKAPWDGVVLDRHLDAGAFIQSAAGNSAAQPMLKIAQVTTVRVSFALPNSEIPFLDIGDRVVLNRLGALPGEEFSGKVTRYSAGLDEQTRMLKVEVELPNPDGKLKPGFFGYVTVFLN